MAARVAGHAVLQAPRQAEVADLERLAHQEKVLRLDVAVLDGPLVLALTPLPWPVEEVQRVSGLLEVAK